MFHIELHKLLFDDPIENNLEEEFLVDAFRNIVDNVRRFQNDNLKEK